MNDPTKGEFIGLDPELLLASSQNTGHVHSLSEDELIEFCPFQLDSLSCRVAMVSPSE